MTLLLKVLAVAVVLAAVCLLGFELWGEDFERLFNQEACAAWFARIRPWAWAAAVGLLVVDLFLPVPATGVMAALGSVYGPVVGALVGATGSALAGFLGYGLARAGGRPIARWIAKPDELARFQRFFDRWGGVAIILSRFLPILPEVVAVLAGLARMRLRRFALALLLGTVPTAALFAWLGHASRAEPAWGMVVAVVVPLLLWPVFLHIVGRDAVSQSR
ncbi:MAG: VTT domain-containing protein [Phycisphaerae bacterium]